MITPLLAQVTHLRPPDVRFVGTPPTVVDAMLELARVAANDVVYDLGSGDGRIPIAAAQKFGARGVGIEIDPFWITQSNDQLRRSGVAGRVVFRNEDLFEANIGDASVVTLFLLPRMMDRLLPKLRRELQPGTRIVSHQFTFGDAWAPEKSQDVDGLMIYLWTIR